MNEYPNFETWQQWECARLGISIDDHNKILEVSKDIEAAGLGSPYEAITRLIDPFLSRTRLEILGAVNTTSTKYDKPPNPMNSIK